MMRLPASRMGLVAEVRDLMRSITLVSYIWFYFMVPLSGVDRRRLTADRGRLLVVRVTSRVEAAYTRDLRAGRRFRRTGRAGRRWTQYWQTMGTCCRGVPQHAAVMPRRRSLFQEPLSST